MKARIPSHREFIINFPDSVDNAKANEGWAKLQQIVEDYKKTHNGASVYAPTFIEDCEPAVKKLQEEYGFEYTVEYVKYFFQELLLCENSRCAAGMKPLKSVSGVLSTKDRTVTTKSLKRLCPSGQGRFFRAIFAQLAERSPEPVVAGQNKKQPRGGAAWKAIDFRQDGADASERPEGLG